MNIIHRTQTDGTLRKKRWTRRRGQQHGEPLALGTRVIVTVVIHEERGWVRGRSFDCPYSYDVLLDGGDEIIGLPQASVMEMTQAEQHDENKSANADAAPVNADADPVSDKREPTPKKEGDLLDIPSFLRRKVSKPEKEPDQCPTRPSTLSDTEATTPSPSSTTKVKRASISRRKRGQTS